MAVTDQMTELKTAHDEHAKILSDLSNVQVKGFFLLMNSFVSIDQNILLVVTEFILKRPTQVAYII